MRFRLAPIPILLALAAARADNPKFRVQPNEVLVVFSDTFRDGDGNGQSDSRDIAEYYARRRGVPAENLLPLDLGGAKGRILGEDYPDFYEHILTPLARKLGQKADDGTTFKDRIVYILLCHGLPTTLDTHLDKAAGEHPVRPGKPVSWNAAKRSVDHWLIDVDANFEGGFDQETGKPKRPDGGVLGGRSADIRHPELHFLYTHPARARHFKELKRTQPGRFPYYLVARLGLDVETAATQVDGAIYAERYLRLAEGDPRDGTWHPRIVLDHQPGFGGTDHVASLARLATVLRGGSAPPLFKDDGQGLLKPWPVTADNQRPEIGEPGKERAPHPPTLTARIEKDGVDTAARLVTLSQDAAGRMTVLGAPYWSPGLTVASSSGGKAEIVGLDLGRNALRLSTVEKFEPGDTITWTWSGEFPIADCFVYYGFYGLGKKWDCYQFLPGAIGIHVDSSCMNWARQQLTRGLSVGFGVVNEPFSAGVPYMDRAWVGLATGHDVCESLYAALPLNTRWAGVLFADPLYAPFRSLGERDLTPPVLEPVTVRPGRPGELLVSADLAEHTPDQRADIALFKIDYGQTPARETTVPYLEWPEPANTGSVAGRRYRYTRRFRHTLTGLKPGTVYHLRVTARDPYGNEGYSADLTARTGR